MRTFLARMVAGFLLPVVAGCGHDDDRIPDVGTEDARGDDGRDGAIAPAGRAPKYTISDKGAQLQNEYRAWCARRGVRPAGDGPRLEVRARYPVRRGEKLRGRKGAVVRLVLGHHEGRAHLAVIRLRAAA